MSRRIAATIGSIAFVITAVFLTNYLLVYRPLSFVVDSDTRNKGVSVFAHYDYLINPNILVFDLRDLSDSKAPLDVFRVLLEFAAVQKNKDYEVVKIAFRGKTKFLLMGTYFKTLGAEHGSQNPIYTIRTFSEHLYKPDGTAAFGTWTGGLLGVLAKQMEDFSDFHKQWYLYELAGVNGSQALGKDQSVFNLIIAQGPQSWNQSPYKMDRSRVAIENTADQINELIQTAQTGHGLDFQRAVNNLSKVIPNELP